MLLTNLLQLKKFEIFTKIIVSVALLAVFFAPLQGILQAIPVAHAQATATCSPSTPGVRTVSDGAGGTTFICPDGSTINSSGAAGAAGQTTAPTTPTSTGVNSESWCSNVSTCLTSVVYLFTVGLMSTMAYIGAAVFNFGLQLALNGLSYSLSFLSQGWAIVRDIANLTFIFILIYIAYTIIVNAETAGTMKTLAVVIVMALLINFSFFLTRVVIDAGNILSIQFYNAIPAPPLAASAQNSGILGAKISSALGTGANVKDLTGGIMQAVSVQNLLNTHSFQQFTLDHGFLINVIVQTTVYIAVGAIFFLLAIVFVMVGFKFLIRMVTLWFLVVAAPLAFAARAVPENHTFDVQGYYKKWQQALIESAFYPAIFLFMFFIITLVMNGMGGTGGLVGSIFNDLNTANSSSVMLILGSAIANVVVRLGLVLIMLFYAMKWSDSFVQYGGQSVQGAVSWAGGLPARAVIGGGAWAARNTVGRGANAAARSQTLRNFEARAPFVGGSVRGVFKSAASSSFDARNAAAAKSLLKDVSVNAGKAGGKDGYVGDMKRKKESIEKQAKDLKDTPADKLVAKEARIKELTKAAERLQNEASKASRQGDTDKANELHARAAATRDQAKDTTAVEKEVNTRLATMEKARLLNLADSHGERNITNLGFIPGPITGPSRGSLEGASKVRNMAAGKDDHAEDLKKLSEIAKRLDHHDDEHHEGDGPHDDDPHGGGGAGGKGGGGPSHDTKGGPAKGGGGTAHGPHAAETQEQTELLRRLAETMERMEKNQKFTATNSSSSSNDNLISGASKINTNNATPPTPANDADTNVLKFKRN